MIDALRKVIKRLHYPLEVMMTCVRWYAAYPLSLRHVEEMMAERGVFVDHSTVSRWAIRILPVLEKIFRKYKRPVGGSWRMDETYVKVNGKWKYLYRAVDKEGKTIDFLLTAKRDKAAAKRFFDKAMAANGTPEKSRWTRAVPTKPRSTGSTPTWKYPWWYVRSSTSIILWNKTIAR